MYASIFCEFPLKLPFHKKVRHVLSIASTK
jgi:hypothetical protein